uniref:SSX family member 2 interacting protein n=1 Tax=Latimeria chalumnae TaxID=7897 RepID=H3AH95_LATCH
LKNWLGSFSYLLCHSGHARKFISRYTSRSYLSPSDSCDHSAVLCSPLLKERTHLNCSAFCWSENLDQCISYLNREVQTLGLPSLYEDGFEGPERGFNLVALVNCAYGLLRLYQETHAKLGSLESEQFKSNNERDFLRSNQVKLKDQIEACQTEAASLQVKEQQLQTKNKNLHILLKTEKEEVLKLRSIISSRATQHSHEMRRKEQELNKVKQRMNHFLMDKRDRRAGMDVLNIVGRADGKRATWKTEKSESKKEEEMYKVLVGNLEKQLKELMAENSELKQLLDHMKRDMHCILASHKASVEEDSFAAALDLEEGEEDLLKEDLSQSCEAVQEQLTRTVRKQWRSLKSHVEKLGAQKRAFLHSCPLNAVESEVISMTDHDKEIAKLKVEIEQSREVISMQQHLLQEHTAALNSSDLPTPLRDSYFLEEQEHLKEEWEMFEEQRKKFELERRNFTEAAIRLGYERQKFEEERALLVKQQFLSLTPFVDHKGTPTWKTMTSFT